MGAGNTPPRPPFWGSSIKLGSLLSLTTRLLARAFEVLFWGEGGWGVCVWGSQVLNQGDEALSSWLERGEGGPPDELFHG